ncbi:MAG TPA: gamma-glutamylcyclotransferase family protein [Fluviicoccus sp.]|nr:gamma-glutamylcyclotransferase family protein [Fluviicoccus sp.]
MGDRLAAEAHWLGKAVVRGDLYRVSWYPALMPGNGRVIGDVYGIPEHLWIDLDRFEGIEGPDPEYRRQVSPVQMASGLWLDAWVYWYVRSVADLTPVSGGDWLNAPP